MCTVCVLVCKMLAVIMYILSVTDSELHAGDVLFADMKSENGRPAGYGTVRYKNPDDAMKAIGILCCVCLTLVPEYYVTGWLFSFV